MLIEKSYHLITTPSVLIPLTINIHWVILQAAPQRVSQLLLL